MKALKNSIVLICSVAVFSAMGGDILLAQSFAWAKMFYGFTRKASIETAITKTFDGKHPCHICDEVARISAKDARQLKAPVLVKEIVSSLHPTLKEQKFFIPFVTLKLPKFSHAWVKQFFLSTPKPPPRLS